MNLVHISYKSKSTPLAWTVADATESSAGRSKQLSFYTWHKSFTATYEWISWVGHVLRRSQRRIIVHLLCCPGFQMLQFETIDRVSKHAVKFQPVQCWRDNVWKQVIIAHIASAIDRQHWSWLAVYNYLLYPLTVQFSLVEIECNNSSSIDT